tara:strand:- start:2117 stop:3319 length:1203 start_codon:yes stop_codon:yes gene_type:complete
MKLLMISLGNDVTIGNGERTIERHLKYAKYSQIKIYMVLLSPIECNNYKKEINRENNLFIYPIASKNHFILVIKGLIKAIKLCSINRFNLIYSQDPFGTGLIANIIRKIYKVPFLLGNHSSFADNPIWVQEKPIYFKLLKLIMKLNLPLADAWRVNNKKEKEYYIKNYGISPNRIIVNNTLVNSEIFSQTISEEKLNKLRSKITDNEETKLLIWAGRPVKFKRIDLLLETFKEVIKKLPNTKLILVGNFNKSNLFKELLEKTDLETKEKLYIFGKGADHSLLSNLYQISDIYIHTSIYEGFGVVLAEAALSGLPIVGTLSDGTIENIEDNKSGFIVDSSLSKNIAKPIIRLLKNDNLRKKMGKYAKSRAMIKYDQNNNLKVRDKLWKDVANGGLNCQKPL